MKRLGRRWALRLAAGATALAMLSASPAPLEAQARRIGKAAQRGAKRRTILPRQGRPRAGKTPRARGPGGGVDRMIGRLMEMPPARRRDFLETNRGFQRLPANQRRRIENQLLSFDRMPAERREMLLQRYQLFSQLSPQQQGRARKIYQQWRNIPADRRRALSAEVKQLRQASPDERKQRFTSKQFQGAYDKRERRMIEELTKLRPADR